GDNFADGDVNRRGQLRKVGLYPARGFLVRGIGRRAALIKADRQRDVVAGVDRLIRDEALLLGDDGDELLFDAFDDLRHLPRLDGVAANRGKHGAPPSTGPREARSVRSFPVKGQRTAAGLAMAFIWLRSPRAMSGATSSRTSIAATAHPIASRRCAGDGNT